MSTDFVKTLKAILKQDLHFLWLLYIVLWRLLERHLMSNPLQYLQYDPTLPKHPQGPWATQHLKSVVLLDNKFYCHIKQIGRN